MRLVYRHFYALTDDLVVRARDTGPDHENHLARNDRRCCLIETARVPCWNLLRRASDYVNRYSAPHHGVDCRPRLPAIDPPCVSYLANEIKCPNVKNEHLPLCESVDVLDTNLLPRLSWLDSMRHATHNRDSSWPRCFDPRPACLRLRSPFRPCSAGLEVAGLLCRLSVPAFQT